MRNVSRRKTQLTVDIEHTSYSCSDLSRAMSVIVDFVKTCYSCVVMGVVY